MGHVDADGLLTLVQLVRLGDAPPQQRTWHLRPDGPARWTGTLSDASGAADAEAEGDRLRIRYSMSRGLSMDQTLTLQPGGQAALNQATVRFLGVPVARLTEQIHREGRRPTAPSIGVDSGESP